MGLTCVKYLAHNKCSKMLVTLILHVAVLNLVLHKKDTKKRFGGGNSSHSKGHAYKAEVRGLCVPPTHPITPHPGGNLIHLKPY